jgi:putative transposase
MDEEVPKRKRIRLQRDCYKGGDNFLVTICTEKRQEITKQQRETIINFLVRGSVEQEGCISGWVLMPDHLHVLITGASDLIVWVEKFKSATVSSLKRKGVVFRWQRSFHDRGIRPGENLQEVARYMLENPVRANLASDYLSWPWSYVAGMKEYKKEHD